MLFKKTVKQNSFGLLKVAGTRLCAFWSRCRLGPAGWPRRPSTRALPPPAGCTAAPPGTPSCCRAAGGRRCRTAAGAARCQSLGTAPPGGGGGEERERGNGMLKLVDAGGPEVTRCHTVYTAVHTVRHCEHNWFLLFTFRAFVKLFFGLKIFY